MPGEGFQFFHMWHICFLRAGDYPRDKTFPKAQLLAISPSSQSLVDFALAVVFLLVSFELLPPGFFFLCIATRYFAEIGQDLQRERSVRALSFPRG